MSDPFTDISAWQHLQDRTAANEIVQAYSERRQCVGDSAVSLLGAGDNAQDTAFWRGMQEWVVAQAEKTSGAYRWIDHTKTIDGQETSPFYTLSTWRTNSGLTSGFRRATSYDPAVNDWTDYNDPMYSYGAIQTGDIRGPWIFEDLHRGLDALRWSTKSNDTTLMDGEVKQVQAVENTQQGAIDEAVALYDSADWVTAGANPYYVSMDLRKPADNYICDLRRERAKVKFQNVPDHISADVSFYMGLGLIFGDEWNDVDFPVSDEGTWFKFEDFGEKQTNEITTNYPIYEDAPVHSMPVVGNEYELSDFFYGNYLLFKWNFSHVYYEPIQRTADDAKAGDLVEVF